MPFDLEHIDPEVVKNIKALQDKLALFGVTFDLLGIMAKLPEYKKQVIAEIIAEIRLQLSGEPLPADVDAVGDKLRLYLAELVKEAKVAIASQIFEAFEKQKQEYAAFEARLLTLESRTTTSAGTVDIAALVQNPALKDVIVDLADKVVQTRSKQFLADVYERMQQKYDAMKGTAQGQPGSDQPQEAVQKPASSAGPGGLDVAGQVNAFFSTPIGERILDHVFPPRAVLGDPMKRLEDATRIVKIARALNLDGEGTDKLIAALTGKDTLIPPTPPAKA